MTFPISLKSGRTNALASCAASLIALIPVFIANVTHDGHKKWAICSSEIFNFVSLLSHIRMLPVGKREFFRISTAFPGEQKFLCFQSSSETDQVARRADHAVARDYYRDGIPADGGTDGADGLYIANLFRNSGVAAC